MVNMEILWIFMLFTTITAFTTAEGDSHCTDEIFSDDKPMVCSTFTTTLEAFFPLVDREYRYRSLFQSDFKENISLSMYRYYMAQHLYARLIQIRSAHGLATKAEERFQKHLHSIAENLPGAEFQYLNGIGDIRVYDGNVTYFFKYSLAIWPNRYGHFGRVDADSHWKYMSFPAPSVVAQAIREDYRISLDPNLNPNWDLRPHLFPPPDDFYPGSPTANLLGWKPSTPMTLQQRENILSCGINGIDFDEINSQFFLNPRLVAIVRDHLEHNDRFYKNFTQEFRNADKGKLLNFGTVDQLGWLERNQLDDTSLSRSLAAIERDMIGKLHPLQRISHRYPLGETTLLMAYRVKKQKDVIHDWAVYDWQNYESVPEQWLKTRNTVFEFGGLSEANSMEIPFSDKIDAWKMKWIQSFLIID